MLNILERATLFDRLAALNEADKPNFGLMTPQHMVEHLTLSVRFANGKDPQRAYYRTDKAERIKHFVCYTDQELPAGFRSPVLPVDELPPLRYGSLSEAVEQLAIDLSDFDAFFQQDPQARPTNPTMGALDYSEWLTFHNKHFTHHFRQFSLIP